jgi:DNA polymerase III epsilon subunit-like protein
MIDKRNFCVFDFETSGRNTDTCEILSVGSVIIKNNTFEIIDEFVSLVQPSSKEHLETDEAKGALDVNHLDPDELMEAPTAEVVFKTWADWIKRHNINKDKNSFGAPIATGWGSDKFDVPILERYCHKYGYWDAKWSNMTLMNPVFTFDVMKQFWLITRTNSEAKNCKLGAAAIYMGISEEEVRENAHNALWDVKMTAKIGVRFLKLMRYLSDYNPSTGNRRVNLANCFVGG